MRQTIRGWRSAKAANGAATALATAAPAIAHAQVPVSAPIAATSPYANQEPFKLGLGLIAFTFYLWVTHSYKLPAGEIAVIGLGIGALMKGGSLRIPMPLRVSGLLLLWATLGLTVTESNAITLDVLISYLKIWVITVFLVNAIRTPADLRFAIIAWLGIYALYPIRGALYNQYICHCTEFGRVAWNFVFENPNDLAAFSLIPLGLAAAVATLERVKFWWLCGLVGVAVVSLIIMLTQSRGTMLAIGVGTILLIVTSRRRGRDLALLGLLMGAAAIAAPRGVWQRLAGLSNFSVEQQMIDVDPEGSANARWQIWQVAAYTIQKNPLMGVGAGMMPTTHRWEALRRNLWWTVRGERDTHSTYLRLTAETGIPGLAIYLTMWGTLFWHIRRVRNKIKLIRPREYQALVFIEASLIAFMVASIFGTYMWVTFTYIGISVAWLAASILEHHPWYVPPDAMPGAVPAQGRR